MGMKLDHCHRASCKQIIEALKAELNAATSDFEIQNSQLHDVVDEITTLKAELLEEARLNGMGSEREAKLIAENQRLKDCIRALTDQCAALVVEKADLKIELRNLLTVTHHLKPCPGTVARCEELLR
jgi:chromosome segregation ATPase